MTAPRASKRTKQQQQVSSKTTTAKKRKALADRSVNVQANERPSPTKKTRASRNNAKQPKATKGSSRRRKPLEVGAEYDVYVQEKKDRNETLHPATYDEGTGGYYFTPKGKKTPIAFDGRRHKLVKKTPEKKDEKLDVPKDTSLKERLEDAFDSDGSSNKENIKPKKNHGVSKHTENKETDASDLSSDEDALNGGLLTQREKDSEPEFSSDEEDLVTAKDHPKSILKNAASNHNDNPALLDSEEESTVVTGKKRSGKKDGIESPSGKDAGTRTRGGGRNTRSRRAASRAPKSYYDEGSEDDYSSSEEQKKPRRGRAAKSVPKGKRRAATRAVKKRNQDPVDDSSQHSSEDESEVDEAALQESTSSYPYDPNVPLSKQFLDSFGGNDWRVSCAIDY